MKDGRVLDDVFTASSVVNMRKMEIATIMGTTSDFIVTCRRHQLMIRSYYEAHVSESSNAKYEGAILHVIDKETGKAEDEREMR